MKACGIRIRTLLGLTVAGVINAIGITFFLSPVRLFDSGISGTSMLLAQLTPDFMSLSLFLILLNIPLFLLGWKKRGLAFTIYSVYAVAIYSLAAWLITDVLPVDVSTASPMAGQDLLLCALFGGILSGVGSGLTIRMGGALDGIEVMAVLFAKNAGLSIGSFVMIYNVILYTICGLVLGSWILPLYSIVTYMAALKTVDFIVDGFDRAKAVWIITERSQDICQSLSETFGQGITILDGKGYYSDAQKTVVYIILNRFQITQMRQLVHSIDPFAYIAIHEVADVFKAEHMPVRETAPQASDTQLPAPTEEPLPEGGESSPN